MRSLHIPFKKKVALELFRVYRKNTTKIHELSYLLWECTLRCNLTCRHCGSDCKKESAVRDMPLADFLKAIDSISPHIQPNKTTIVITGGEALLRKDLEECGEELYKRGYPWGLVTNGYLLNQARLNSLLNAGLRSITVSLDGLQESHNWLRNNSNSFRKAFDAISLLPTIPDLKYDVVTCVNPRNLPDLEALKEKLIQAGVKYWRIFTIFPVGRAREDSTLRLSTDEFKEVFEFIRKTRTENRINVSYSCEGFLGNYEGEARDGFFFCRAGINIASILVDGSISACPDLRDNFIQGNIYKDDFMTIWNNEFIKYRDRSWTKTDECATCDSYRYCEGNGLHLRNEKDGKLLFCHLKMLQIAE
jgi:radical SAM enzyme (rSAM/lipoprotein system)